MKARISITVDTPFDDEDQSMDWIESNIIPAIDGHVVIDVGGMSTGYNQTCKKRTSANKG